MTGSGCAISGSCAGDPLPEDAIRAWVTQAIELNKAKGDPTKPR